MGKLFYCLDCRRIFPLLDECSFCHSKKLKPVKKMTPINIIGSKHKGRVFKATNDIVTVLLIDQHNRSFMKDFHPLEIQKIL